MNLNLYLPPAAVKSSTKAPVIFYLSGLTCTGDNCAEKGFLQAHASKQNIAIVYPDTSPRGAKIAGEDDSWDFGTGAGFYVDATTEGYRENYKMYSYITEELPKALFEEFGVLDSGRVSICGHSMGGHGALTIVYFFFSFLFPPHWMVADKSDLVLEESGEVQECVGLVTNQ